MVAANRKMWVSLAVSVCVVTMATAAGQNEYLPPNKGYSYDPPAIPFPPQNNPNKIPTQPTYRPPRPTQPAPRPNTYIPPSPGPSPVPHEHEHHEHHEHEHHHEPGMPFDFSYAVNEDDNNYSHNAISDGDVTRGEYRVALPDGRTQIVKYTADWRNGFNAEVSYEGEARYPDAPTGGYGRGPANQGGQEYLPPNQGGGYQY